MNPPTIVRIVQVRFDGCIDTTLSTRRNIDRSCAHASKGTHFNDSAYNHFGNVGAGSIGVLAVGDIEAVEDIGRFT